MKEKKTLPSDSVFVCKINAAFFSAPENLPFTLHRFFPTEKTIAYIRQVSWLKSSLSSPSQRPKRQWHSEDSIIITVKRAAADCSLHSLLNTAITSAYLVYCILDSVVL